MTECRNPEIQDLLPDYASASLDAANMSAVAAHLSECEPCSDDLMLLRRVRALPMRSVEVDVARIAAAIPRPGARPGARPALRLERNAEQHVEQKVAQQVERSTETRAARRWSASVWQIAAAVGVMVVGGASVLVTRSAPSSITAGRSNQAILGEAAESALVAPAATGTNVATAGRSAAVSASGSAGRVSVSYGDLGDYSEAELQRMLDRLESWDGASSAEPLPGVPVVTSSGGY